MASDLGYPARFVDLGTSQSVVVEQYARTQASSSRQRNVDWRTYALAVLENIPNLVYVKLPGNLLWLSGLRVVNV